jgi:hypothetical protein
VKFYEILSIFQITFLSFHFKKYSKELKQKLETIIYLNQLKHTPVETETRPLSFDVGLQELSNSFVQQTFILF